MKIGGFNLDEDVLVVAEIGNNHEGRFALAEEMVDRAAEAGAGAVKFQTFRTEQFHSRKDSERFARLKSFELTFEQFERLSERARRAGILFISTPLDLESAAFLGGIVSAYKIASSDNTFYPLLDQVGRVDRPVILSCGLIGMEQIARSAAYLRTAWKANGISQDLAALHCVTSYPVSQEEANLGAIAAMKNALDGLTVGYSDHTLGIDAAVLSVALGARIVEKHFTLDKNQSGFRDHQLSADPPELAGLVKRIKEASTLLGSGIKAPQPGEKGIEKLVRRSIAARRDLPAGAMLRWDDLIWTRPSGGLPPGSEDALLGRTLRFPVPAGDWLTEECLAPRG